jgi:hypothetical protein
VYTDKDGQATRTKRPATSAGWNRTSQELPATRS